MGPVLTRHAGGRGRLDRARVEWGRVVWFAVAFRCATTLLARTTWTVEYEIVPGAFGSVGPVLTRHAGARCRLDRARAEWGRVVWLAVAYHCATTLLDRTTWAVEYGVVPHAFGVDPVPVNFARRAWAHARSPYSQVARIRMCATTWGGALLSYRS